MSKVMTWDKSKENKKQKKRPDGTGSSKFSESFKRSKPPKPTKPSRAPKPDKPVKSRVPKKPSGQAALRKRKKK